MTRMVNQKHLVKLEVGRAIELAATELVRKVMEPTKLIDWYWVRRTYQSEVKAKQQRFKKLDWTNHQWVELLMFELASLVHQNLINLQSFMVQVRLFAQNSWNQMQILIFVLRVLQRHHHRYQVSLQLALVLVFSLSSFSLVYLIYLLISLFLVS